MTRNDITGDIIATGKGSYEKYADGWEAIFRQQAAPEDVGSPEEIADLVGKIVDSMREPTTVMALDFHDSRPVTHNTDAEQAREEAWMDAVMRVKQPHTATFE